MQARKHNTQGNARKAVMRRPRVGQYLSPPPPVSGAFHSDAVSSAERQVEF